MRVEYTGLTEAFWKIRRAVALQFGTPESCILILYRRRNIFEHGDVASVGS